MNKFFHLTKVILGFLTLLVIAIVAVCVCAVLTFKFIGV